MNYNIIQRCNNKVGRPVKNPLKQQLTPLKQQKYRQFKYDHLFQNQHQNKISQKQKQKLNFSPLKRISDHNEDVVKMFKDQQLINDFDKTEQQVNQRKRVIQSMISHQLTNFQLQKIFNEVISWNYYNQKYLFEQILEIVEKVLGNQQKIFISEALNLMLKKQCSKSQAKVYICSKSLKICLGVIKIINKKVISKFKNIQLDPFKLLNKYNKNILAYLKSKYPRNKNLFVSHQLEQAFQQVNFLSILQSNIIAKAGFCFTTQNYKRSQTLGKIKKFLNFLMDQINTNIDPFSNLLKNQAFLISDLNIKKNKVKIGRKIPQNVERYYDFDSQNLDITSPQIFRVLIKWIQPLVQLFQNPAEQINARSEIKYFKQVGSYDTQYFKIRSKRYENMKTNLIQKILDNKMQFRQKFLELIDHLDSFNNNLVKVLMFRKSTLKFLPQDQVQILKFSKYNTQFLEWIVVQKLLILIEQLSHLTLYFQTKYLKKIDFINFNVYDLLRASFSGTKNQILEVYTNLKKMQSKKKITILRIKNRIDTPLNDVLINFKMSQCILVCQLQLVLIQSGQQSQQKLKIVEDLNHIIYELERSPYGPISQMALAIGYTDPSIQYQQKIKFQQTWILQSNCQKDQQHEFQDIKPQQIPFVCSWCLKYYARLQNFFQVHKCKKCSFNKCKSCIFKQDKQQQKKVNLKYLASCLLNISLQRMYEKKDQDYFLNLFLFGKGSLGFLMDNYIRVRDQIQISKQSKLKKLQKFLYKKQQQYDMKGEQPFYCLLLHFSKGQCNVIILKYVNFMVTIANDVYKQSKRLILQQYDVIFLFPPRVFKSSKSPHIVTQNFNRKQNFIDIRNGKKKEIDKLRYQVTYISYFKKKILLQLDDQNAQEVTNTKKVIKIQEATQKIKLIVQRCQLFNMAKRQVNISRLGISQDSLPLILKNQWKFQIKVINVEKNRISSIQSILSEIPNLQQLSAGFNLISKIKIVIKMELEVLNLEHNNIELIQSDINFLSKLQYLNLSNNKIQRIDKLSFRYLQQLNLHKNKITDFKNIIQSELESLQILQLSQNCQSQDNCLSIQNLKFPYLRKLQIFKIKISSQQKFQLSSLKYLQYIDASFNSIRKLQSFQQKQLRQVIFNNCQIISIENTFSNKLSNLLSISMQNNEIKQIPVLKLEALQYLKLTHNKIVSIQNFALCYFPKLKELDLSINQIENIQGLSKTELLQLKQLTLLGNKISNVPALKFQKLQKLILMRNNIVCCQKLSESILPMLKLLNIKENKIKMLPKLDLKKLRQFYPQNNQITNIDKFCESSIQSLKLLSLWNNKIETLPALNFNNVQVLFIYSNELIDVMMLEQSCLSRLKKLSLIKNKIANLPVLQLQALQSLYIYKNQIQDVSVLQKWKTPQLRYLQISNNKIKQLPRFHSIKLNQLYLHQNSINDLRQFSESKLPSLLKLNLQNNKIKKLVKFAHIAKLKQLHLNNNQIQELADFGGSNFLKLLTLNLGSNKIAHISQFQFPMLEQLVLKKNRLQTTSHLQPISLNLKKLHLTDNKLSQFPKTIIQNCSIEQLLLSRNWLQTIQINLQQKIRKLLLINCGITDKSVLSIYLPSLQQLNLKQNHLQKIQFLTQNSGFQRLKKVYLDNNKITMLCTINLGKLQQFHISNNPLQKFDQFFQSKLPSLKLINLKSQKRQKQMLSQMHGSVSIEDNTQSYGQSNSQTTLGEQCDIKLMRQGSLQVEVEQNSEMIQKMKKYFPQVTIKF